MDDSPLQQDRAALSHSTDEQRDRKCRQQLAMIRKLIETDDGKDIQLNLCTRWLGIFTRAGKEETTARNYLVDIMYSQLKNTNQLSSPFTEMGTCNRELRSLLRTPAAMAMVDGNSPPLLRVPQPSYSNLNGNNRDQRDTIEVKNMKEGKKPTCQHGVNPRSPRVQTHSKHIGELSRTNARKCGVAKVDHGKRDYKVGGKELFKERMKIIDTPRANFHMQEQQRKKLQIQERRQREALERQRRERDRSEERRQQAERNKQEQQRIDSERKRLKKETLELHRKVQDRREYERKIIERRKIEQQLYEKRITEQWEKEQKMWKEKDNKVRENEGRDQRQRSRNLKQKIPSPRDNANLILIREVDNTEMAEIKRIELELCEILLKKDLETQKRLEMEEEMRRAESRQQELRAENVRQKEAAYEELKEMHREMAKEKRGELLKAKEERRIRQREFEEEVLVLRKVEMDEREKCARIDLGERQKKLREKDRQKEEETKRNKQEIEKKENERREQERQRENEREERGRKERKEQERQKENEKKIREKQMIERKENERKEQERQRQREERAKKERKEQERLQEEERKIHEKQEIERKENERKEQERQREKEREEKARKERKELERNREEEIKIREKQEIERKENEKKEQERQREKDREERARKERKEQERQREEDNERKQQEWQREKDRDERLRQEKKAQERQREERKIRENQDIKSKENETREKERQVMERQHVEHERRAHLESEKREKANRDRKEIVCLEWLKDEQKRIESEEINRQKQDNEKKNQEENNKRKNQKELERQKEKEIQAFELHQEEHKRTITKHLDLAERQRTLKVEHEIARQRARREQIEKENYKRQLKEQARRSREIILLANQISDDTQQTDLQPTRQHETRKHEEIIMETQQNNQYERRERQENPYQQIGDQKGKHETDPMVQLDRRSHGEYRQIVQRRGTIQGQHQWQKAWNCVKEMEAEKDRLDCEIQEAFKKLEVLKIGMDEADNKGEIGSTQCSVLPESQPPDDDFSANWQRDTATKVKLLQDLQVALVEKRKTHLEKQATQKIDEEANKQEALNTKSDPKFKWDLMWSPMVQQYIHWEDDTPTVGEAPMIPSSELNDDQVLPNRYSQSEIKIRQELKRHLQHRRLQPRASSSQEYFKPVPLADMPQNERWSRFLEDYQESSVDETQTNGPRSIAGQITSPSSEGCQSFPFSLQSSDSLQSSNGADPKYSLTGKYCPHQKAYVVEEELSARQWNKIPPRPHGNTEEQNKFHNWVRPRVSEWEQQLNSLRTDDADSLQDEELEMKHKGSQDRSSSVMTYCIQTGRQKYKISTCPQNMPSPPQSDNDRPQNMHSPTQSDKDRLHPTGQLADAEFGYLLQGELKARFKTPEMEIRQLMAENVLMERKLRNAKWRQKDSQIRKHMAHQAISVIRLFHRQRRATKWYDEQLWEDTEEEGEQKGFENFSSQNQREHLVNLVHQKEMQNLHLSLNIIRKLSTPLIDDNEVDSSFNHQITELDSQLESHLKAMLEKPLKRQLELKAANYQRQREQEENARLVANLRTNEQLERKRKHLPKHCFRLVQRLFIDHCDMSHGPAREALQNISRLYNNWHISRVNRKETLKATSRRQ